VKHADQCLGTLVDAVRAAGMEGETLFILSADHGGHGRNHDGHIPEDRLIPWIAWGPGVRPGHKIDSPIITLDTAATALWALGLAAPPDMKGKPVLEAFDAPTTASNP
jgi:arylsulfatase A-like enzyme